MSMLLLAPLLAAAAGASQIGAPARPGPAIEPAGSTTFAEPQKPETLLLFPLIVDPAAAPDAALPAEALSAERPSSHREAESNGASLDSERRGAAVFDGAAPVRSLDVADGTLLINGKAARELSGERSGDVADERAFVHPEDERLVVRTFYSSDSLAGFRRQGRTLESVLPLASAGLSARVVQSGELSVTGRGLVHFIVQEAVDGKPLAEQPRSRKALTAARRMIDRVAAAGLAIVIPATEDAGWLYRRIIFGRTPSGGEGAYITRAEAERRDAASARAHADLLRSFLRPAPGWTPAADEPGTPKTPSADLFGQTAAAKTPSPAPIAAEAPPRPSLLRRTVARVSTTARALRSAFSGERGVLFAAALGWPASVMLAIAVAVIWPLSPVGLLITPPLWLYTCFIAWSRHIDGFFKAIFVSTLMVETLNLLARGTAGALMSWGPGLGVLALAGAAAVIIGGMLVMFRAMKR